MAWLVEVVRVIATALNIAMFLSPLPTMREIYRTKSVGHMPFVPLAAMVSNAHVWVVYGWLAKNYFAIFASCSFGMIVATGYVAVYYKYTNERAYARKVIALFACVMLINTVYPILGANGYTNQSYNGVRLTVGYIAATSSVVMYSSPFEKIVLVFKHRSAVFIPIQIVVVGSINSLSWVILSLLDVDLQVFVPNVILLVIGLVQIALYWAFHPAKHPLQSEAQDDEGLSMDPKDLERQASVSFALSPTHKHHNAATDKQDGGQFVALRSPLAPLNLA